MRYWIALIAMALVASVADAGPIIRHVRENHAQRVEHRLEVREIKRHGGTVHVTAASSTSVTKTVKVMGIPVPGCTTGNCPLKK